MGLFSFSFSLLACENCFWKIRELAADSERRSSDSRLNKLLQCEYRVPLLHPLLLSQPFASPFPSFCFCSFWCKLPFLFFHIHFLCYVISLISSPLFQSFFISLSFYPCILFSLLSFQFRFVLFVFSIFISHLIVHLQFVYSFFLNFYSVIFLYLIPISFPLCLFV